MTDRHQYQDAYDDSIKRFSNRKPHVMADLAAVFWEEPFLRFNYLNIPVQVDWTTKEMLPDNLTMEEKIILFQYLAESTNIPFTGNRWVSFLELPEGQHHYQPFVKEAFDPLTRKFGTNSALFYQIGREIGAIPITGGDVSFKIQVLPKISMMLMLWEEDDEFPARINILFDGQVSCHLPTATIYMLGIAVAERIGA